MQLIVPHIISLANGKAVWEDCNLFRLGLGVTQSFVLLLANY